MIEYVIKRDGRKEAFDPEKLNSWGIWASKTIDPKVVNWSSVVLRTVSTLPKQVTTDELQKALIKSCIDMDTYEHNRMAGRLYADALPKQLYKDRKYPHIRDLHKEMSKKGLIRKDINYTDEEYDRINKMIKHKRDIGYTYYSSHHIMSKYAKKDHTTKKTYETPQFVYMRVAMQTFLNYEGEDRMEKLENLYTKLSTRKINIPTPYFANSLTSNPNVASCFLPGALVDTSTKRQAIATVGVGTEVLTHTGTYKKVIDKFSRKFTGKLVGLTTVASYPQDFECTYNHRIYAVKRTSAELAKQPDKSSPEWIEADHLRVGDYIKLGIDLKETPFNYTVWDIIKNNEEVSNYELIDNVIVKVGGCLNRDYPRVPNIELNHPDFFRLVGYYLAEGCITKPSVGSSHFDLTFRTKDEYFIADAKNICLNLFGLDLKEYPRTQDNSTKLVSYSKVLCALMLELCGTGFNTKFLTSPLMTAPRELQEELLVGIIRGDGCSTISGFKLSLANKELMYQLKNIALRLNLHISLSGGVPSERYRNRVPMCTLQINVDGASLFAEKVAKDIHKIRKNKSHPGLHILFRDDGVFARVRGIYSKEVDDIEVWDLTVEEDHSFVVNSLSVHNCSVLTTKDEAQSIGIGSLLAYSLTTSGAGLGLHLKTRSLGDAVRGGDIEHSGKVPYYRAYAHSIKSSKQGCYDTETEVLTDKGWRYFKDLTEQDLIVQVHDDLSVEAVKPTRIVEYKHIGKMYKFGMSRTLNILVTPDHRMVYKQTKKVISDTAIQRHLDLGWSQLTSTQWISPEFSEARADEANLSRLTCLFNSANTSTMSEEFSPLDALKVAYQADGFSAQYGGRITFHISKTRKQLRLEGLLEALGLTYEKTTHNGGVSYVYRVNKGPHEFVKNFSWVLPLTRSSAWLKAFLEELEHWDGSHLDTEQNAFLYTNTNEECIDTVQMAATLCGAYSYKKNIGRKKDHHQDRFTLTVSFFKSHICSSKITKEEVDYDDMVYCVEVPSNKIIVRRKGLTLVCGNSRGGAGTMYFPFFDPEVITLLNLKNPLSVDSKRLRELDYALLVNKWFVRKAIKKEPVWLFSYKDNPELYELFYDKNPDAFGVAMEEFAQKHKKKVTEVNASEILAACLRQSVETGRVYMMFADEANRRSPYKEKIYSSNLCVKGDTLLRTLEHGDVAIQEIVGQAVTVWNGHEWSSDVIPVKTGEGKELLKVNTTKGSVKCTPYHKFHLNDGVIEAKDLIPGMRSVTYNDTEYFDIVSVEPVEGLHDTYCVNEPLRHTVIFNGILTGNCTEILLPTKPYGSIEDLSSSDVDKGTVAFCNLAGIVVDNIEDDTDYEESCYYALLMIDEGINNALLPYESLNHSIRYYRSAGVGILGLAHLMAKNKLSYKSREGLTFIHNLAEKHAYYLYKSALRLGKERGNAECMDRTLFPDGWLPIDVMNPNLGDLCDTELKYDWETLRQEIVANGGIRFSTVSTIPPSENCLAFDTKVKTDKGDMTLKEIFDGYVDTSLDEAMKDYSPLTGGKWYELNQPLKALTASGEYHTIPRIWLNGIVKPFKITLEDGTVVKATESHKFLTDRGWVPAYDLKVGDNIINIAEE